MQCHYCCAPRTLGACRVCDRSEAELRAMANGMPLNGMDFIVDSPKRPGKRPRPSTTSMTEQELREAGAFDAFEESQILEPFGVTEEEKANNMAVPECPPVQASFVSRCVSFIVLVPSLCIDHCAIAHI